MLTVANDFAPTTAHPCAGSDKQRQTTVSSGSDILIATAVAMDSDETLVQSVFWAEASFDALFTHRDEDGTLRVFAVAREHDDDVYEAMLRAEDKLNELRPNSRLSLRVRAHQGRSILACVPVGTMPSFYRGRVQNRG